jgi:hypothetical protein
VDSTIERKNIANPPLVIGLIVSHALIATPMVIAEPNDEPLTQQITLPPTRFNPGSLPVGLIVNGQPKLDSFNVLGQEDGSRAINFDDWLLPFDELSRTLGFKIKEIDGKLDISTASQRFQIPVAVVVDNRTLGRAIAVRDLAKIPGFVVKFDLYKYAIDLQIPAGANERGEVIETPIVLDGLDTVSPDRQLGANIIQQRVTTSGISGGDTNTQGEFQAAGNIFGAGWYLRINQPTFSEARNWNITEGVILRQRDNDDLIIGSQTPFWHNRGGSNGSYWGATTVSRQGFVPPTRSAGDFSLGDRLQSKLGKRTIAGLVEPGTLVQLVRADRDRLVKEVLVDSSGVYRFDNVIIGGEDSSLGRDYKILLYPRGQLTANPIVRDVTFTSIPGQIPVGAEAIVVSGGGNRIAAGNFGTFDNIQGGVLYRRGISEALTLGAGIAYDKQIRGVGELFWQPSEPTEIAMSATTGSGVDFLGRLSYRPANNFFLSANIDQFSTTANTNWRITPNFSATGTYESLRGATVGGEYFTNTKNASTLVRGDISDRSQVRAAISQRWENLQANVQTNESSNNAELSYRIPTEGVLGDGGHEFVLGYQNSRQTVNTNLTTALWRYRSPEKVADGRFSWQAEVGYGWNGFGAGLLTAVDVNLIPGIQLRGSYRGIADTFNQGSYAIEFTTNLLTNGGIRGTFDRVENFRNVGKIVIQPFLDNNQNGRQDPGEEGYWDSLLIRLNERPLAQYRPQLNEDRGDVNLPNGSYRLDIDPAGYPMGYRSRTDALRVEVAPSGITTVSIPLVPAYIAIGSVKDSNGAVVAGARVEATNLSTKNKIYSITNDAGFYTLEGLEQGEYQLSVSGLATTPSKLRVTSTSPPTQEFNLTVTIPTEQKPPIAPKTVLLNNYRDPK